jgi:hypothetical protein
MASAMQQASTGNANTFDYNLINSIVEQQSAQAENIDNALLEDFKNQVKIWWELDTAIKRLQIAVRERKKAQNVMNAKILEFMRRHNIEDLNTKDGVLRYKATYVKAPLSQRNIKDKLSEYFERDPNAMNILRKVFEERDKVEKVTLRRIKM